MNETKTQRFLQQDTEEHESETTTTDESESCESSDKENCNKRRLDSSEEEVAVASSGEEYSDWMADNGGKLRPPKRVQRQRAEISISAAAHRTSTRY